MSPQTLEALKGSIEKWRKIVEEGGVDQGDRNCPLCKLFNRCREGGGCAGCPVDDASIGKGCNNTPYEEWQTLVEDDGDATANTDEKMIAARAELDFLRSLLPQEESGGQSP
jgi:hypothetical protein